jgi:outer membrane protein assembly factor BamB
MCYNLTTGQKIWQYEDYTGRTVFPYFTLMLGTVADGKIFVGTHEHSADTPLFKGNKVRAINVTDGSEVWTMYGWAHPYTFAVADGTLIYWNNYDHQVYAVAKGPTSMTVEAPHAAITTDQSLVITGTVMDISAGTRQHEQAMRFPNGVPAVSEDSMSHWMEYVYMQKARPTNATGVEVSIDVVDSNGNYRNIGTTTSDANGVFSLDWMPDISGKYTVIATFAGSEAYWPSRDETAFGVEDELAPTDAPPEQAQSMTDAYVLGMGAAILIAIIAVGVVMAVILRRRP